MDLFGEFLSIVCAVLKNHHRFDDDLCDMIPCDPCTDQQVGNVGELCKQYEESKQICFVRKEIEHSVRPRVVVVLESPHKDEYYKTGDHWIAIGPACGCTGCRLIRNWHTIFGQRFDGYELVLVNAIQYQCSLASIGEHFKRYKDKIVSECLWLKSFQKDFLDRIISLSSQNVVFINACTRGNFESGARSRISKLLKSKGIKFLCVDHPSSWFTSAMVERQQQYAKQYLKEVCNGVLVQEVDGEE